MLYVVAISEQLHYKMEKPKDDRKSRRLSAGLASDSAQLTKSHMSMFTLSHVITETTPNNTNIFNWRTRSQFTFALLCHVKLGWHNIAVLIVHVVIFHSFVCNNLVLIFIRFACCNFYFHIVFLSQIVISRFHTHRTNCFNSSFHFLF